MVKLRSWFQWQSKDKSHFQLKWTAKYIDSPKNISEAWMKLALWGKQQNFTGSAHSLSRPIWLEIIAFLRAGISNSWNVIVLVFSVWWPLRAIISQYGACIIIYIISIIELLFRQLVWMCINESHSIKAYLRVIPNNITQLTHISLTLMRFWFFHVFFFIENSCKNGVLLPLRRGPMRLHCDGECVEVIEIASEAKQKF